MPLAVLDKLDLFGGVGAFCHSAHEPQWCEVGQSGLAKCIPLLSMRLKSRGIEL